MLKKKQAYTVAVLGRPERSGKKKSEILEERNFPDWRRCGFSLGRPEVLTRQGKNTRWRN